MLLFLLSRKETLVYSRFHSYSIRLYYSIVCRPLNNVNKSSENTLIVTRLKVDVCLKGPLKAPEEGRGGRKEERERGWGGRKEGEWKKKIKVFSQILLLHKDLFG